VASAIRSLAGCSSLVAGVSWSYWSYVTRTPFSLVFWLLMSFTARRRLIPTVFEAWMFVVTRPGMPI
jgi:hypothetical protein